MLSMVRSIILSPPMIGLASRRGQSGSIGAVYHASPVLGAASD